MKKLAPTIGVHCASTRESQEVAKTIRNRKNLSRRETRERMKNRIEEKKIKMNKEG